MPEVPSKLHLYWDGSPMAWLQVQTIATFQQLNPDWEVIVYTPLERSQSSQKFIPDYLGHDHFPALLGQKNVKNVEVDFQRLGVGTEIPDILRSDILRYQILHDEGGVWSDFDVLWLRPMSQMVNMTAFGCPLSSATATVCFSKDTRGWHNIGVLTACPGHPFYRSLLEACRSKLCTLSQGQSLDHQEFGVRMINALYPDLETLRHHFPDVAGVSYRTYYPYGVNELEKLWIECDLSPLNGPVMAVHWFNGHPLSKAFLNGTADRECSMTEIIRRFVPGLPTRQSPEPTLAPVEASPVIWEHEPVHFFQEVETFIRPTSVVLDLGCGIRPMTFYKPGVHILAEPFGEYVEMLRHQYHDCPGIVVLQVDSLTLLKSLPDASVDSIFLLDVIEHLPKEEGRALIVEMKRVARVQVVVFTPLGFHEQDCRNNAVDGWGLSGTEVQTHRSGWLPSDFPAAWRVHLCRSFHCFNWKGEPVPPFGAFFAILTKTDWPGLPELSARQRQALRFMPDLRLKPAPEPCATKQDTEAILHRMGRLSDSVLPRLKKLEKDLNHLQRATVRLSQREKERDQRPRGMRRLKQSLLRLLTGGPKSVS